MEEFNNKLILISFFGMLSGMCLICGSVYVCNYLHSICRYTEDDFREESYLARSNYLYYPYGTSAGYQN